jgi:hypothetical protein
LSHLFPHKHDREKIVEVSSKISLLQLQFDEISTKIWMKIRRFCFGKNFVAKRGNISSKRERGYFALWQNVLPQKKRFSFVKDFVASTRAPKKFRRKNLWQNLEAKCFATNTRRKSNEILTKGK